MLTHHPQRLPHGWALLEETPDLVVVCAALCGHTWRILFRRELHEWVGAVVQIEGCTRRRIASVRRTSLIEAMGAAELLVRRSVDPTVDPTQAGSRGPSRERLGGAAGSTGADRTRSSVVPEPGRR